MKKTLKFFSVFLLLAVFTNCQKDDILEPEGRHFGPDLSPVKYLYGKDAAKAKEKLKQAALARKISIAGFNGEKSDGWDVDFNEVLYTVSDNGIQTHTYRLNHPDLAYNQFYNLVHAEDAANNVTIMVVTYTMENQYATSFMAGTANTSVFQGSVAFTPVLGSGQLLPGVLPERKPVPEPATPAVNNPCIERVVINTSSSGSGGYVTTPGNGSSNVGGGTTNNYGGLQPIDLSYTNCLSWFTILCSENKPGHTGGNDGCTAKIKGATYLVNRCTGTMTQTKSGNTGHLLPCDGLGNVGVLFPEIVASHCEELKRLSNNTAFNDKMAELKTKAGTQAFESAYVLYENATQGLLFSNEYKGSTAIPEVGLKTTISQTQSDKNAIGFIHCHLNGNKTFKIFSLSDIVALAKLATITTRNPEELVVYLTTASGTFALKINNITQLRDVADKLEFFQEINEGEFKKYVDMKKSIDKQILGFLKYLKNENLNIIDLYQKNEDVEDEENFGNWQKLEMNGFSNGYNKKNC